MKMPPNVPENKFSRLLTHDENLQVFKLLGNRCQSICTTVVQLYCTEPPHHQQWIKRDVGVLCFVKDNIRKNYFFRLFCLRRNIQVWEQEMYNNMEYMESTVFLHIFEGEDTIIAFNFASVEEARDFKNVVDDKIAMRKRKEEKRARQWKESQATRTLDPQDFRKTADPAAKLAKRKRNITKADIGCPLDFKHISHVGWNPDSGFDINVEDAQLRSFFEKAGISEKQLQDRDTKEFIYNFINRNGGREAIAQVTGNVSRRTAAPPPPPPPSSSNNIVPPVPPRGSTRTHVRTAPPPPPPIGNHIKSPSSVCNFENNERPAPPPPPPPVAEFEQISVAAAAPPPPPPPPPPPISDEMSGGAAAAPPPPLPQQSGFSSDLLESIKSGTTLKPVEERKITPVDDSRNDLLSEIRKGTKLKPVGERDVKPINNTNETNRGGNLAEALARALAERSKAIHSEDDDDSTSDSNDEWDD